MVPSLASAGSVHASIRSGEGGREEEEGQTSKSGLDLPGVHVVAVGWRMEGKGMHLQGDGQKDGH